VAPPSLGGKREIPADARVRLTGRLARAVPGRVNRPAAGENPSARGAYVLAKAEGGARRATVLATGSEVALAVKARAALQAGGVPTAVVSMPSWELFERQDRPYRDAVLGPRGAVRVGVEAAVRLGWDRYLGEDGGLVGMSGFGASGPERDLFEHFGITPDAVVAEIRKRLRAEHRQDAEHVLEQGPLDLEGDIGAGPHPAPSRCDRISFCATFRALRRALRWLRRPSADPFLAQGGEFGAGKAEQAAEHLLVVRADGRPGPADRARSCGTCGTMPGCSIGPSCASSTSRTMPRKRNCSSAAQSAAV
jgi:hypothetical protein